MRTMISSVIIVIAAVIGFFMEAGMNQAMGVQHCLQRLQVLPVRSRLLRARKISNFQLVKNCKYLLFRRLYAMKKQLLLILTMSLILLATACKTSSGGGESKVGGDETATFQATIIEIQDGCYLVEPVEGSAELNSADRITIPMANMEPSPEPEVGDVLEIEYDGSIAESYPAQITKVYSIRVAE